VALDFNRNPNQAIEELCREKKIPRVELIEALESALASAYRKRFGTTQEVRVEVRDSIRVFALLQVVQDVEDERTEISIAEAQESQPDIQLDEQVQVEVTPKTFGRIAAQTAKHVIVQKIREAERRKTFNEYHGRAGELITARIQRFDKGDICLDFHGQEMLLPVKEQIPGQRFRTGDRITAIIQGPSRSSKGPMVQASRCDPQFLRRLFEREIPEIQDGLVQIVGIAREPGIRSKVAVRSLDSNIDPVGACVGLKGSRIQTIVAEVANEKVDIIHHSEDVRQFVAEALSPAHPERILHYPSEGRVVVVVPDRELSLAIGREGQTVRLAARLTNVKIDITTASRLTEGGSEPSAQEGANEGV